MQHYQYADIILPLSIPRVYTYGIPLEWQQAIRIGMRVEVQFGQKRAYSGIVKRLHNDKPDVYAVKPIRQLLDEEAIVTPTQLQFWEWIAGYYACTEGDVMNAAMPAHLKLASETYIGLYEDAPFDPATLTDEEYLLMEALLVKAKK